MLLGPASNCHKTTGIKMYRIPDVCLAHTKTLIFEIIEEKNKIQLKNIFLKQFFEENIAFSNRMNSYIFRSVATNVVKEEP